MKSLVFLPLFALLLNSAEPPRVPFHFETNQGQAPETVRYLARTKSYQVFLEDASTRVTLGGRALTISLPGSRPSLPVPEGALPSQTDYVLGNNPGSWRYGISNYRAVRRKNIYPGIDKVYYGNPNRLEYDFVVHPGGTPGAIRVRIDGGEKLKIDVQGNLVAKVGAARFIQHAPIAYQNDSDGQRRSVIARWRLANARTARIEMGDYDGSKELIIDPEIEAAGVVGGPGKDEWVSMLRAAGFGVLVGVTDSLDYPGSFGNRGNDITLVQMNLSTMEVLRVVYIGGSGKDTPLAASVLSSNNYFRVVGATNSRDFPVGNFSGSNSFFGVAQQYYGGGASDGFLFDYAFPNAGFSSPTTPPLVYSTYIGGSKEDRLTAVNNSAAAGETLSDDLPTNITGSYRGGWDAFYLELDSLSRYSSPLRGAYFGGSGDERVKAVGYISHDSSTNNGVFQSPSIAIAGSTTSPDLPLRSEWQSQLNGPTDGFVHSAGWFTSYWGGSGEDEITSFLQPTINRVILAGSTTSSDFPTMNAVQSQYGGGASDAFLTQLDLVASPTIVTSTYHGGSGADVPTHLFANSTSIYLAGTTSSANFPVIGTGQSTYGGGSTDVFLSQFKLDLTTASTPLLASQFLGASGTESVFGLLGSTFAFNSPGITIGVNSDSPETSWRGANNTSAPGGVDGIVMTLTEPRITASAELYIASNQSLFSSLHVGGSGNLAGGIDVSITSSDPAKLKIFGANNLELTGSRQYRTTNRDFGFSIRASDETGDVLLTVSAAGYPDQVIRVHVIRYQWFWTSIFGTIISSVSVSQASAGQIVQLVEGFQSPGASFVSYIGNRQFIPSTAFTFRSTNPNVISVSQYNVNRAIVTRVVPGEADIIADGGPLVVGPPPLHVEFAEPPQPVPSVFSSQPAATIDIVNGFSSNIYTNPSPGTRMKVRIEDSNLAQLVDPLTLELSSEAIIFPNFSLNIVGRADSGSTRLIYSLDGKEVAVTQLNLVPAELRVVVASASQQKVLTLAKVAQPVNLAVAFKVFGFDSLYGENSLTMELTSSNPDVATIDNPRITWIRGSSSIGNPQLKLLSKGETNLMVRLVDGPPSIRFATMRLIVEDALLAISGGLVGKNLQTNLTVTSPSPFQVGTTFVVESGDPTRLLVGGQSRAVLFVDRSTSTLNVTVAGLTDSGVVPVTVSAPGWPTVTANVQLTPSAFAITRSNSGSSGLTTDPSQLLGPLPFQQPGRISTSEGSTTNLAIGAFAINQAGAPLVEQPLRAGLAAVPVRISSDDPSIVESYSLQFTGQSTNFDLVPLKTGVARLVVEPVSGFSRSSIGNDLVVESLKRLPYFGQLSLAKDTQTRINIPQDKATTWTITCDDPNSVLVSADAQTAGVASITVNSKTTPEIYVQALAGSGTQTITFTSPDYQTAKATVLLSPLLVYVDYSRYFSDPAKQSILGMNLNSQPTTITMGFGSNLGQSSLRPGVEFRFSLTSANKQIALLSTDTITLKNVSTSQSVLLRALSVGKTELRIDIPESMLSPNVKNVIPVEVQGQALRLYSPLVLGNGMMREARVEFLNSESQGTVRLTLESSDPARVLLSSSPTQMGTGRLTITTRPTNTQVYIQALGSEGEVTISAKADGYEDAAAIVSLRGSGLRLSFDNISSNNPFTSVNGTEPFSGSLVTTIVSKAIDKNSPSEYERIPLRPGANWAPLIESSDPNVVRVLTPQPTIDGGATLVNFQGVATGSAEMRITASPEIALSTPPLVVIRLKQFPITEAAHSTGRQIQYWVSNTGVALEAPVTITSSNPARLLISLSERTIGSPSVTIPAGQPFRYFIQGILEGSANITLTAAGYTERSIPVTIGMPAIIWAPPNSQNVFYTKGDPLERLLEVAVQRNGVELVRGRFWPNPGLNLQIGFSSSNPLAVNTPAPVTISGSSPQEAFLSQFSNTASPLNVKLTAAGQAAASLISITPPPGWLAGGGLTVEARASGITVTVPSNLGKDSVRPVRFELEGFPASQVGLRIRVTSSDPSRVLLSTAQELQGITSVIQSGNSSNAYLHVLSDNGTARITASVETAAGAPFVGVNATAFEVKLVPSVWIFQTATYDLNRNSVGQVQVSLSNLGDKSRQSYYLRPGVTASVGFTLTDSSVLSIRPNPVQVNSQTLGSTIISPLKAGETTITINAVPGFSSDAELQTLKVKVE